MEELISSRAYFIRAIYSWIVDNGLTPYLLVDAGVTHTDVPEAYVKEGKIILNVSPGAVRDYVVENDFVGFSARFGGVARSIYLPIQSILALYARENGKGLFFDQVGDIEPPPETPRPPKGSVVRDKSSPGSAKRPSLKVIK